MVGKKHHCFVAVAALNHRTAKMDVQTGPSISEVRAGTVLPDVLLSTSRSLRYSGDSTSGHCPRSRGTLRAAVRAPKTPGTVCCYSTRCARLPRSCRYYYSPRLQSSESVVAFALGQAIEFCQLLVFVVNPRANFPWKSTVAPLQEVAHFSILSGYYEIIGSAELYLALVLATGGLDV